MHSKINVEPLARIRRIYCFDFCAVFIAELMQNSILQKCHIALGLLCSLANLSTNRSAMFFLKENDNTMAGGNLSHFYINRNWGAGPFTSVLQRSFDS